MNGTRAVAAASAANRAPIIEKGRIVEEPAAAQARGSEVLHWIQGI